MTDDDHKIENIHCYSMLIPSFSETGLLSVCQSTWHQKFCVQVQSKLRKTQGRASYHSLALKSTRGLLDLFF